MVTDTSSDLPMNAPAQVVRLEAFDGKTCVVSALGEFANYQSVAELDTRIRRTPIGDECAIVLDAAGVLVRFSAVLRDARVVDVTPDRILLDNDIEVEMAEYIRLRSALSEDSLVRRDEVVAYLRTQSSVTYVRTLDAVGTPTGRGHVIWVDV